MIRTIVIWLLCVTVANAQYLVEQRQDAKPTLGQSIAIGAERAYADKCKECDELRAKVAKLEAELAALKKPPVAKSTCKIVEEFLVDGYGNPSCPACEKWWNGPEPAELRASGWDVGKTPVARPLAGQLYPRWRVCVNDEPCVIIGYTKDFKGALQRYLSGRKK